MWWRASVFVIAVGCKDPETDTGADGPTLAVRVEDTTILANGYLPVPVRVLGTNEDGSPWVGPIVLNTDRPGTGTFDEPAPTLTTLGADVMFTPCSSTTPGCTGPFEITAAFADDPDVIVATSGPLELVGPEASDIPIECSVGGNAMYFDGNDYIYNGTMTVVDAVWDGSGTDTYVRISVEPTNEAQGLWWDLEFSSEQLGVPLEATIYEDAQRAPFAEDGHPGLEVTGDGRGCNTLTGRFEIHQITWDGPNNLSLFTASFEQHCEGGSSVLNGCVHWAE